MNRTGFLLRLLVLLCLWAGGGSGAWASSAAGPDTPSTQPAGPSAPVKQKPWIWQIQPGGTLGFEATQGGVPFRGTFPSFGGTIQFRPSDLPNSFVDITIQMRNMVVDGYDRNSEIRKPAWLDTFKFPTARYAAVQFRDEGNDIFTAYGYLTLKGMMIALPLRFKLTYEDVLERNVPRGTFPMVVAKRAHLKGLATLPRAQFNIGPAGASDIGPLVKVFVSLTAERPPVVE